MHFHRDFQYIDSYRQIIDALNVYAKHSPIIKRCTTPGEAKQWDEDCLNKFDIFADQIDRLYFFDLNVEENKRFKCHMIFRINCPGIRVYVALSYDLPGRCDGQEQCRGSGYMLISENANLFMNQITLILN